MSNSSLATYRRISPWKNSPRNHKIDTISIHCIVGQWTAKQGCDFFATTENECSANYVVGKDGSIGVSVDESDRSWCTSSSSNDNRAITIEVASDTTHPYAVTSQAYEALIKLCADICKRNGIKKLLWKGDKSLIGQVDKQNMTVHRWFAQKACPGDYLYNRHGEIAERVNKLLGEESEKYTLVVDCKGYMTADNAKNHKDAKVTYTKGEYFVFNKASDMINVTKQDGVAGAWINPSDNVVQPTPPPTPPQPEPTPPTPTHAPTSLKFKVGDEVVISGDLYVNADASVATGKIGLKRTKITRALEGHKHPYNTTGDLGWMNESDIKLAESNKLYSGKVLSLNKVPLYASSTSTKDSGTVTGTYYVSSDSIIHDRIKITNSPSRVGNDSQVTGWIDVKYAI